MQLQFVGYETHGANNPDNSIMYDGNPIYVSPDGIYADGYWLIEHGFQAGLGDNPEVPPEQEHWFIKKPHMSQERLALLKELLAEARKVLPKAQYFEVKQGKEGELLLHGESSYITGGEWNSWTLSPDGRIDHKEGLVY